MRSAVLFLVFNRPDTTKQVFEAIKHAKPPRLYIAADGPRSERLGEKEKCEEVRRIATAVDWECDVKVLFREKNLGCKVGVSSGIDWFFELEEEGIILEDDILPIPSFFPYCDELLERYRHDTRVGVISGCNLISKNITPQQSYFFSRYNHVWGWASWRSAWVFYDISMHQWPTWRDHGGLQKLSDNSFLFKSYWGDIMNTTYAGKINTWDYQWLFTLWSKSLLTAIPKNNLTYNLGFGEYATHTTGETPKYIIDSKPNELTFPLLHPDNVERNKQADKMLDRIAFNINISTFLKRQILKNPFLCNIIKIIKRKKINIY
jgi:hypothetical protein